MKILKHFFELSDIIIKEVDSLSATDKQVLIIILKYFRNGLMLNESGTDNETLSAFNLFYAWYKWITEINMQANLMHLNIQVNLKLNINDLCHIYTETQEYISKFDSNELSEMVKIVFFALQQVEKVGNCSKSENFKDTLESFNYICKDMEEGEGELFAVLSNLLKTNG